MRKFESINQLKIIKYLDSVEYSGFYNYKNTKSSCIDQKCTFDILEIVCRAVLNYLGGDINKEFNHFDFLDNTEISNTIEKYIDVIGKATMCCNTKNEYNKFFQQTFEMLSYVNILEKNKKNKRNIYTIKNMEIFKILSIDKEACECFICMHVFNLIKDDEDIINYINEYNLQKSDLLKINLKKSVMLWISKKSNDKHKNDVPQISLKILNPIFYLFEFDKYKNNKYDFPQTIDDLKYIRIHPRYRKKKFRMTQKEFSLQNNDNDALINNFNEQKKKIKKLNLEKYNLKKYNLIIDNLEKYTCEITNNKIEKPDIHHIWMKNYFDKDWPFSSNEIENLILLDSNWHRKIPNKLDEKYIRLTFEYVLPAQFKKILYFEKNPTSESYDIYKFYQLICYIIKRLSSKNIYNEDIRNLNKNFCIGEIDSMISNYKIYLSKHINDISEK